MRFDEGGDLSASTCAVRSRSAHCSRCWCPSFVASQSRRESQRFLMAGVLGGRTEASFATSTCSSVTLFQLSRAAILRCVILKDKTNVESYMYLLAGRINYLARNGRNNYHENALLYVDSEYSQSNFNVSRSYIEITSAAICVDTAEPKKESQEIFEKSSTRVWTWLR